MQNNLEQGIHYSFKGITKKSILLFLFFRIFISLGFGQSFPVNISIAVSPPYYSKVSYYINQPNKVMATFTNSSQTTREVYILATITGEGGIRIYTDPSYKMPQPVTLQKNVPYTLKQTDLQEVFSSSHLLYQGITSTEIITNGLPEGDYRICLRAFDYSTNQPVSAEDPDGCSNSFTISEIEPPSIQQPVCDADVPSSTPQSVTFTWTKPVGAPQSTIFKLKIIEVLASDQNIIDAINSLSHPVFFEKTVTGTFYLLGSADPSLITDKKYAFIVTAIDPSGSTNFLNQGMSEVCSFTYPSGSNPPSPPTSEDADCQDNAQAPAITNNTPSTKTASALVNAFVTIGKFKMKILTASGSSSALSGTGSIVVNWLHTPIAVEFSSIKINMDDQIFEGKVISQIDNSAGQWPTQWALNGAGSNTWVTGLVKKLDKWMHNNLNGFPIAGPKLIKDLDLNQQVQQNTNTPLKLPLGLNDVKGYTIAITEMKFEPGNALLNCVSVFPVLEHNDSLGFQASNIEFSPNSPSIQSGKLGLISDVTFTGDISNYDTYSVIFKKEHGSAGGTYITWNCKGFKELNVDMDIVLPRSWVTPVPDNGTDKVTMNIVITVSDWNDWLIQSVFPRSAITGTQGMELEVQEIWYDHSDKRNPTGIKFPSNYKWDSTVLFHGFYLKSAKLILPDNFRTYANASQDVQIDFNNIIIDKKGFTGRIIAKNIFNFPKCNISGLGASIDTIKISLICSSLDTAFIKGRIVLPVTDTTTPNALLYKALFTDGDGFQFTIEPKNPITARFFSNAKLTLLSSSSIILTIKQKAKFNMSLDGHFDWDNINLGIVKNVSMGFTFNGLGLQYDEQSNTMTFNPGVWSFASPQQLFSGFPVSVEDIQFKKLTTSGTEVLKGALSFALVVNLDQNKIGGRATFDVIGAIDKPSGKKFVPKFIGVDVSTIKIFANLSAVKLDGLITFFHEDQVYGNGFAGTIKAKFNSIELEVDATLRFGSTNYSTGHNYNPNSPQTLYRYWYVDAKVILPKEAGIPFLSGLAFYGFGAGVWRHMTEPDIPPVGINEAAMAAASSGASFIPNKTAAFGFKVTAVIGTYPSPKAVNADVTLEATFSSSDGLMYIGFSGNFWAITELTAREEAPVKGGVSILYDVPTKHFNMSAYADINKYPISGHIAVCLDVNGSAKTWHFTFGTPQAVNNVDVFGSIKVQCYFMVGNDIGQFMGDNRFMPFTVQGLQSIGINLSPYGALVGDQTKAGKGFSFGIGVGASTGDKDIELLGRVYLRYNVGGGFEINLTMLKYPPDNACPVGYKGWYMTGNVAAWFKVYAGIHVVARDAHLYEGCLWCCAQYYPGSCDFTIFEVGLGAYLSGGFPNPSWAEGEIAGYYNLFDGALKGDFDYKFSTGDKCQPPEVVDNQTYVQEDATSKAGDMILVINPENSVTNFDPGKKMGITFGLTPDEPFDIDERQSNGTIVTRTFQPKYFVTLDSLGPVLPPLSPGTMANPQTGINQINQQNPQYGQPPSTINQNQPTTTVQQNPQYGQPPSTINQNQPTTQQPFFGVQSNVLPPVLIRSKFPNSMGEYLYWLDRGSFITSINQTFRNLSDTTKYKLTIKAELWELKNGSWVKAKDTDQKEITENRTIKFSSGKLVAQNNNVMNNQNYIQHSSGSSGQSTQPNNQPVQPLPNNQPPQPAQPNNQQPHR